MTDFLSKRIRDGIPTADLMEAIESLVITDAPAGVDADLMVDAGQLMASEHHRRFWPLQCRDGDWRCNAGPADTLLGQLTSIAMSYRAPEENNR